MKKISKIALCTLFPLFISFHPKNNTSKIFQNNQMETVYNYKIKAGIFRNAIKIPGNVKMGKQNQNKILTANLFSGRISYNFYKNDSIYIEKTSFPDETYIYKKIQNNWKLISYESKKQREYKKNLEGKFKTNSKTIIEISEEYFKSKIGDTVSFFLLGEEYYFFKKSENNYKKNAEFCVGGVKKRKEDKTLFSNKIYTKFNNSQDYPQFLKTSFEVKGGGIFNGEYVVTGERK
jgi:hypothetical protein